jgi:hypothetical protein
MKTKLEDVTNKYQESMETSLQKLGVSKEWSDKHLVFYMVTEDKPKEGEKK